MEKEKPQLYKYCGSMTVGKADYFFPPFFEGGGTLTRSFSVVEGCFSAVFLSGCFDMG